LYNFKVYKKNYLISEAAYLQDYNVFWHRKYKNDTRVNKFVVFEGFTSRLEVFEE
jgi:hypothetical protein